MTDVELGGDGAGDGGEDEYHLDPYEPLQTIYSEQVS